MKVICRSQTGVAIPLKDKTITIYGYNQCLVIGSSEYINEIADNDWLEILANWSHIPEIQLGLIIADQKVSNVKAQAKELEKEKMIDDFLSETEIDNDILKKSKKVK